MEFKDLVELKLKGKPLPQGLSLDVKKEIDGYVKVLGKLISPELLGDAIVFFAEERQASPQALEKALPLLLEHSANCRKYYSGICLTPAWLKRRTSWCWVCPRFSEVDFEEMMGSEVLENSRTEGNRISQQEK